MAFLDFLFGKGEKTQEFQRYTPEQQQYFGGLLGGAQQALPMQMQYLQSILSQDPKMMAQFQRPAMRQFEEEIVPGIAERFTGTLGPGAQRSSAFGQQLGQAGAGLAERLAAQRAGLGMQALGGMQALTAPGLGQMTDQAYIPRQAGIFEQMLPIAGQLGTQFLGGGIGNLLKGLTFLGGPKSRAGAQGITHTSVPYSY